MEATGRPLSADPAARRARKRAAEVDVAFAPGAGVLPTLEGEVRYEPGDALVTGGAGDRWPVVRARFDASYEPVAPTPRGADGRYRKHPQVVRALCLASDLEVPLASGQGTLAGRAGDWLVEYAPGDQAIVSRAIFATTYELLD